MYNLVCNGSKTNNQPLILEAAQEQQGSNLMNYGYRAEIVELCETSKFNSEKRYKKDSAMGGPFSLIFMGIDSINNCYVFRITNHDCAREISIYPREAHKITEA